LGIAVKRKHCKDFGVWVYEFAWVSAGVHGFLPVSLGFVRVSVSFSRFFLSRFPLGFLKVLLLDFLWLGLCDSVLDAHSSVYII
jgi:hypothetical protein